MVRQGRTIVVQVGSPRLVLFEWQTAINLHHRDDATDPRCIGFLILEANFPEREPSLDDLLAFNEAFRFWQLPYGSYETHFKELLADCPLTLHQRNGVVRDENFLQRCFFERWASLLQIPLRDAEGKTWRLFPDTWAHQAREWVETPEKRKVWKSGWIVYTDNRAFVWTCAIIDGGGHRLRDLITPSACIESPLQAHAFGHWIKLLNVDPPGTTPAETHSSTQFERDWARKRTYHRWEEHGTFYGFNYHCGAMLGPPQTNPPLWQHFGEMYFDQTLLLLYLRIGSFNYSRYLSRISALRDSRKQQAWRHDFQQLRRTFALFTNLYQFPLLSSQQQGLEMYKLARQYMDVEELFREIQEEIRSSHDYFQIEANQEQTEITTRLTVVATAGLAIGLAIDFKKKIF